eukprot:653612-Pyramimonas_sp.AAC.1
MNPALWLRGVPPTDHTHSEFVDPPEAEGLKPLGSASLTDLSSVCPEPLVVLGDGSGGRFSSDPRRRRCGAAVVSARRIPGTSAREVVGG